MRTRLIGIVNVTPDSFSDGGVAWAPEDAARRIGGLLAEGAEMVDVGAESTRPGATPLTAQEEWARLEPVLRLAARDMQRISIDTRHADTAARALQLGAGWINDVSGAGDPAMVELLRKHPCRVVVMHSLSIPADAAVTLPVSVDPVEEVLNFGRERIAALENRHIDRSRIIFDPGIGFGKTAGQSLALLRGIARFKELGVALLAGHSRKSFLTLLTARPAAERDEETLAVSHYLAAQGVEYLRVHAVARHARMLQVLAALQNGGTA